MRRHVVTPPPPRSRGRPATILDDRRRWPDEALWRDDIWIGPRDFPFFLRKTAWNQATRLLFLWAVAAVVLAQWVPGAIALAFALLPATVIAGLNAFLQYLGLFRRGDDDDGGDI